jgi:hypothetical protein
MVQVAPAVLSQVSGATITVSRDFHGPDERRTLLGHRVRRNGIVYEVLPDGLLSPRS